MMELLFVEGLPTAMGRGGLLRLLIEEGGLDKTQVGKLTIEEGTAVAEVAEGMARRTARRLDGRLWEAHTLVAWSQGSADKLPPHFAQLFHWLALESRAEQEKAAQLANQAEYVLERLVILSEEIGLGGRILLRLAPRNQQQPLPWSQLDAGTPVIVREEGIGQTPGWRAVVVQRQRRWIEVALNQAPELQGERPSLQIVAAHDEIARQRMQQAISRAAAAQNNRLAELRRIILGESEPLFVSPTELPPSLTSGLNAAQITALQHALAAQDVAIIHGPPGTGKTTTVVALIRAAVQQGIQVLACAPSNQAVDNVAEGLVAAGVSVVRLGHPARVLPHLQAHTLDALVQKHEDVQLAHKLRKEARQQFAEAHKWRRAQPERGAKQAVRAEAQTLLDEAQQLEATAVQQILDTAQVVLSTLTGLESGVIGTRLFELCVVDEAGQSTEPALWIPIVRAKKVVLAGDHQQLPPTVLAQTAVAEGFGVSLMEQLMRRNGAQLARQLVVQYRMHTEIMAFSSRYFYGDTLQADKSVAEHLLADLPGVLANDLTQTAVTYIDTAGASYEEELDDDGNSRRNPQEAHLLVRKTRQLLAAGVPPQQIGIITPYAAQVRLLRDLMGEDVEINSVDGFQGREKEAILISLVRCNVRGEVGFLAETRRMNVALTRARRKLLVIGDSATITAHPFYAELVDYWDSIGAYHSVWEEADA